MLRCIANRGSCRAAVSLSCLLAILGVFSPPVSGFELTGRLSSDFYGYEEAGIEHLRPHLGLRSTVTAWRGQRRGQLSFHSSLRWRSDLSNQLQGDPQTFVYEAYARLKDMPKGTLVAIGRQYVYSGLSSTLIDGTRIKFRVGGRFEVSAYGGSRVSRVNPEKSYTLDKRGSYGGRFTYAFPQAFRVGLAWVLDKSYGEVSNHKLGLDVEKRFAEVNLFTRVAYDTPNRRLSDIIARVGYRPGSWRLSAEYAWRYPSVNLNSLFSLIDYDRRSELRFNLSRTVWRRLALFTRSTVRLNAGEKTWSGSIGLRATDYHIAWRFQDGDGGQRSGLTGFLRWRCHTSLELYASADLSRYRVQPEQIELNDAYSAALGIRWEHDSGLRAGLEGQYLRNAVATTDYRVLLRVSKSFALGGKGR